MGGRMVVPEPDAAMQKVIKNFMLTKSDIAKFFKLFQKIDKGRTGIVPLDVVFKSISMQRSLVTDVLLEVLDIHHDGEINFSEFLTMVVSYCMFGVVDIMKFCFFVFDQDKAGYFSVDDLKALMNSLHNIYAPDTVKGNVKVSWMKLTFSSDKKVEYHEFLEINGRFPNLFKPAFQLQQQMISNFMGESWWEKKRETIEKFKEEADRKMRKKEEKKQRKAQDVKERKVKKKMGLIMYYMCPCFRVYYDPSRGDELLTADEKAERDRRLAEARRQAELRVKNPETAQWKNFEKKIDPEVGEGETYVIERHVKTERKRNERAISREERKKKRMDDQDLKHRALYDVA